MQIHVFVINGTLTRNYNVRNKSILDNICHPLPRLLFLHTVVQNSVPFRITMKISIPPPGRAGETPRGGGESKRF